MTATKGSIFLTWSHTFLVKKTDRAKPWSQFLISRLSSTLSFTVGCPVMAVGGCSFRWEQPPPQTHWAKEPWPGHGLDFVFSPRKTKAHSAKLQLVLRWKTHGLGLSQFPNGCQISLIAADILKCHSNIPPSWGTFLLLLEPRGALGHHQGQESLTAGAHRLWKARERGRNQYTEGRNPMCKRAAGCSSVEEQIRRANSPWHS